LQVLYLLSQKCPGGVLKAYLKAEMGRKRRQLSKIFGFKEGNAPSHKGKKLEYEQNSSSEPFMRLKDAVFESRVTQESDGVLTILDVDQSSCLFPSKSPLFGCNGVKL
jgi:hypothetical protein